MSNFSLVYNKASSTSNIFLAVLKIIIIKRFTCKLQFVAKVHQFGLIRLLSDIFIECLSKNPAERTSKDHIQERYNFLWRIKNHRTLQFL